MRELIQAQLYYCYSDSVPSICAACFRLAMLEQSLWLGCLVSPTQALFVRLSILASRIGPLLLTELTLCLLSEWASSSMCIL